MPNSKESIQVQLERLNQIMRILPDSGQRAAAKAFQAHGIFFYRLMEQHVLRGNRSNKDILHRRSGNLARALHYNVLSDNQQTKLVVWFDSTAPYAWAHEKGAEITPKDHPYLAIPVGPALTPAGVSKYKSPLDVVFGDGEGLRVMKKKGGKPFLGHVENGKVKVYFLLREKVTIPARLGLVDNWRSTSPLAIPRLLTELKKEIKGFLEK